MLDTQKEANDIIKELNDIKKSKKENSGKKLEENRAKIKQSLADIQKDLVLQNDVVLPNAIDKKDIILGMPVFIPSLNQEATICRLPDSKDNVQVQSGIVKLSIHISKLEKSKEETKKEKKTVTRNNSINKAKTISTELNLIGMTVDEAIPVLEKYLDDAFLANIASVRIVHGKGTGALRKAVNEYLKNNPRIKSYRAGMYGEGDLGVTVVEL